MAGLLDDRYAAERRRAIDSQRAAPDMPPPGDPWRYHPEPRGENGPFPTLDPNRPQPERISHWESDTSYLCVVDEQGNTFSATPSDVVGWSPIVPGLGFPVSGTRHADMVGSGASILSAAVEASTPHAKPCDGS